MEDGHTLAEMGMERGHKLGRESYLRHHDDGLTAHFNAAAYKLDVNGGLAAAGNAVKQGSGSFLRFKQFLKAQIGLGLLLVQLLYRGCFRIVLGRDTEHLPAFKLDIAPFFKRPHRLHGRSGKITYLLCVRLAYLGKQAQYGRLLNG